MSLHNSFSLDGEKVKMRVKILTKNCYCEESNRFLVGRRGNLYHPLRHSEERILRRENLIL